MQGQQYTEIHSRKLDFFITIFKLNEITIFAASSVKILTGSFPIDLIQEIIYTGLAFLKKTQMIKIRAIYFIKLLPWLKTKNI